MDPRPLVINQRLERINNIIAVAGAKGGIGKSSVSSLLALYLADRGYATGLLDLDFYGPSTHLILGAERILPEEEKGIIPPALGKINYMSMFFYSGDNPAPLRGFEVSNSILELLSVVQWGELDFLVIDMPPGIGETTLDVILFIERIRFLLVTTSSRVSFNTVERLIKMLKQIDKQILGVVENIKQDSPLVKNKSLELSIPYLGSIGYDEKMESSISNIGLLRKTCFYTDIDSIFKANSGRFLNEEKQIWNKG